MILNGALEVGFQAGLAEVSRCLGFLDRSHIDPCSDEILMNTVPRCDTWGPVGTRGDSWGPVGTRGDPWGPVGTRGDPCAKTKSDRHTTSQVLETYIRHKEFRQGKSRV